MRKNKLYDWCNKCKSGVISFSIAVRYFAIILVFVFNFWGSSSLAGFGVDSNGLLYVGRKAQVEVYHNGELVGFVPVPVQKEGWSMGVSTDNQIILCAGAEKYLIKTDGTILSKSEDQNSKTANALARKQLVQGNNGEIYRLRHRWICPTIDCDGTVIYRAPFVDVMARVSWIGLFVSLPGMWYEGMSKIKNKRKIITEGED